MISSGPSFLLFSSERSSKIDTCWPPRISSSRFSARRSDPMVKRSDRFLSSSTSTSGNASIFSAMYLLQGRLSGEPEGSTQTEFVFHGRCGIELTEKHRSDPFHTANRKDDFVIANNAGIEIGEQTERCVMGGVGGQVVALERNLPFLQPGLELLPGARRSVMRPLDLVLAQTRLDIGEFSDRGKVFRVPAVAPLQ